MTNHWSVEQYKEYLKTGRRPERCPTTAMPMPQSKTMNKTEAEYLAILNTRLQSGALTRIYDHESIKFRIGDKRCWYSVDFVCVNSQNKIECHEVKGGYYRDDARAKFQSAKKQYPDFLWFWAQKKNGTWEWE
jgi:hypothetical protein